MCTSPWAIVRGIFEIQPGMLDIGAFLFDLFLHLFMALAATFAGWLKRAPERPPCLSQCRAEIRLVRHAEPWRQRMETQFFQNFNQNLQTTNHLRRPAPAGNLLLSPSSFKLGKRRSLKCKAFRFFDETSNIWFFLRAEATGFWVLTIKVFVPTS